MLDFAYLDVRFAIDAAELEADELRCERDVLTFDTDTDALPPPGECGPRVGLFFQG